MAFGILAAWPGIEPRPQQWKDCQGIPHRGFFFFFFFFLRASGRKSPIFRSLLMRTNSFLYQHYHLHGTNFNWPCPSLSGFCVFQQFIPELSGSCVKETLKWDGQWWPHLGFTDPVKPPGSSLQAPADLPLAISTAPPSSQGDASSAAVPPPYQLISLPPHLETLGIQEDPQDYLLLINCQSKKPEPSR